MYSRDDLQKLYRYCCSLSGDGDAAYDLLQSAIEKVLRQRFSPEPGGSAKSPEHKLAYTRTTIRNLYIDRCRRQALVSFEALPEELPADINANTLEELVIQQKTLEEIWPLFDATDREILFLWAVQGLSASEVAEETGSTRNTVLSRIHRIRQKVTKLTPTKRSISAGGHS